MATRPKAKWRATQGHQQEVPEAPTFHPTKEEFEDPLTYIAKIHPEAAKFGICCIVPPAGWDPPFALEKGTSGNHSESLRFNTRKQMTSQLCMRAAGDTPRKDKTVDVHAPAAAGAPAEPTAFGDRYSWTRQAARNTASAAPHSQHTGADSPLSDSVESEQFAVCSTADLKGKDSAACTTETCQPQMCHSFGHAYCEQPHTLKSFEAYAEWAKRIHFNLGIDAGNEVHNHKKPKLFGATGKGAKNKRPPTVEQVEAEFWRIVETPDTVNLVESLYGSDLDSGRHGSGFPLPPWRGTPTDARSGRHLKPSEQAKMYNNHPWNINNMPFNSGSVLRYINVDELITGVMVPWLYIGSCLSAFCWHVEDHSLYSINYLHTGAPKVWYGVPSFAASALEEAMKDALPHLFEEDPLLLHRLVTMLSPMELQARGVPVFRLVHYAKSFVITFPNSYHAGLNTGFNCAEAVNFAPADWLPFGFDVARKYKQQCKAWIVSVDTLTVRLVQSAKQVAKRLGLVPAAVDSSAVVQPDKEQAEAPTADNQATDSGSDASDTEETSVHGMQFWRKHVKNEDASELMVKYAVGELAVRMDELKVAWKVVEAADVKQQSRMSPGEDASKDSHGVYTNTADIDCLHCRCDLYLSSVVSSACPGKAACLDHFRWLGAPLDTCTLLYRYAPHELESMIDEAVKLFPDAVTFISQARRRVKTKPRIKAKKLGPVCRVIDDDDEGLEQVEVHEPVEHAYKRVGKKTVSRRQDTKPANQGSIDRGATEPQIVKDGNLPGGSRTRNGKFVEPEPEQVSCDATARRTARAVPAQKRLNQALPMDSSSDESDEDDLPLFEVAVKRQALSVPDAIPKPPVKLRSSAVAGRRSSAGCQVAAEVAADMAAVAFLQTSGQLGALEGKSEVSESSEGSERSCEDAAASGPELAPCLRASSEQTRQAQPSSILGTAATLDDPAALALVTNEELAVPVLPVVATKPCSSSPAQPSVAVSTYPVVSCAQACIGEEAPTHKTSLQSMNKCSSGLQEIESEGKFVYKTRRLAAKAFTVAAPDSVVKPDVDHMISVTVKQEGCHSDEDGLPAWPRITGFKRSKRYPRGGGIQRSVVCDPVKSECEPISCNEQHQLGASDKTYKLPSLGHPTVDAICHDHHTTVSSDDDVNRPCRKRRVPAALEGTYVLTAKRKYIRHGDTEKYGASDRACDASMLENEAAFHMDTEAPLALDHKSAAATSGIELQFSDPAAALIEQGLASSVSPLPHAMPATAESKEQTADLKEKADVPEAQVQCQEPAQVCGTTLNSATATKVESEQLNSAPKSVKVGNLVQPSISDPSLPSVDSQAKSEVPHVSEQGLVVCHEFAAAAVTEQTSLPVLTAGNEVKLVEHHNENSNCLRNEQCNKGEEAVETFETTVPVPQGAAPAIKVEIQRESSCEAQSSSSLELVAFPEQVTTVLEQQVALAPAGHGDSTAIERSLSDNKEQDAVPDQPVTLLPERPVEVLLDHPVQVLPDQHLLGTPEQQLPVLPDQHLLATLEPLDTPVLEQQVTLTLRAQQSPPPVELQVAVAAEQQVNTPPEHHLATAVEWEQGAPAPEQALVCACTPGQQVPQDVEMIDQEPYGSSPLDLDPVHVNGMSPLNLDSLPLGQMLPTMFDSLDEPTPEVLPVLDAPAPSATSLAVVGSLAGGVDSNGTEAMDEADDSMFFDELVEQAEPLPHLDDLTSDHLDNPVVHHDPEPKVCNAADLPDLTFTDVMDCLPDPLVPLDSTLEPLWDCPGPQLQEQLFVRVAKSNGPQVRFGPVS